MASTGPWDDSESSGGQHPPSRLPPRRSTLRVSHLGTPQTRRAGSPLRSTRSNSRPTMAASVHVADKVDDLAASLHATSEVLSTADRMLEHYRDINVEQDEEIVKLRSELEKSADLLRRERILRRRRLPATPPSSVSEEEAQPRRSRGRGSVRFSDDVRSEVEDLKQAVREMKSEQNRLSGELDPERDERYNMDSRRLHSRHGSMRGPEEALMERERLLRELRDTEDASRRQAEVLVKGLDAERDVLRESQRIASAREGELESLKNQLQAAQKSQQDEIEKRLKEIQQEMRAEREMWETKQREVGELTSELRNVRSLLDTASDKKIKDEIRSVASELEAERRELQETNHEKRVLAARVDDLASRLEQSERERRQVLAELDSAVKKLDQSEGGKTVLSQQADETRRRFNQSEAEKNQLSNRLEEYQAKLQDNEAARKRLQSRLEALGREVSEGQQDRERLIGQLDVLRNQVSQAEREKEEIVKQVAKATRGTTPRRQSLGPILSHSRRSMVNGSGDVNELRQNIDRLERDLNTSRVGFGDSDGRRGFGRGEFERQDINQTLDQFRDDMDIKDEQQERLISQMKQLLDKYEQSEVEKRSFAEELDNVNKSLKQRNTDIQKLNEELENKENLLKESEKKRSELKTKAVNSLKDYRGKCKRLEREADQGKEAMARNERLEKEMRELRSINTSSTGPSFSTSRRDLDDLMDQRQRLNDELALKNAEIRELQAVRYNSERDVAELRKQVEKLETDLRTHQAQSSMANLEKTKLEEALQVAQREKEQEIKKFERRKEEQQSDLETLLADQKKEIKDLRTKNARLMGKVQQEIAERQVVEDRLIELREQERRTKDENASFYGQLQQEREEHTVALKDLQEQIQSLAASHEKAMQESRNQYGKEKDVFEDQLAEMKLQLADEKSTIKALRNRQEKDRERIESLTSDLNITTEDNAKLQKQLEHAKLDSENAKEKVEVNQSRMSQLEDSVRRSQYLLEKATEEQQVLWQKADDQLEKIVDLICKESDIPLPTLLASGGMRHDSHQGVAELIGKLRWLNEELKVRLSSERRLREQVEHGGRRIRDLVQQADEDRQYFVSELDQQSLLLDQMASQKKGLETRHRQNSDDIKALKDRVRQLTKHLQTSARALHATTEALDDNQKVMEEIDDLKDEKLERDKIHDRYVRYKEKVGSIRKELQGMKNMAEDYKQESHDASSISSKLIESLDKLSSPKAKQRRLQFPDTPSTLRPVSKPSYTEELSPASSEGTFSILSQDYSPSTSFKSDRKRTAMRGPTSRTPRSTLYADLDYKERPSWIDAASQYEEAERDKQL